MIDISVILIQYIVLSRVRVQECGYKVQRVIKNPATLAGADWDCRPYTSKHKHLYSICATSAQRLRRWADIVQMLYKCLCLLGHCYQGTTYPSEDIEKQTDSRVHVNTLHSRSALLHGKITRFSICEFAAFLQLRVSLQIRAEDTMLNGCWASVYYAGPTSTHIRLVYVYSIGTGDVSNWLNVGSVSCRHFERYFNVLRQ